MDLTSTPFADDPPAPDYFHPSERNDETDENSVIEMKDEKVKRGYSGLQDGEVLGFGEKTKDGKGDKYCTKRCACIVWWQVFVLVLLAVGGVGLQIGLIRMGLFDPDSSGTSGAAPVEEETAVETGPAEPVVEEAKYTWTVSGSGDTFSPTLKNVLSFGDSSAEWTSAFPGSEYEMKLTSKNISPTKFSIKTSDSSQMSGFQLTYSDGNVGPLLENESSADAALRDYSFDRWGDIRKISMAVDSSSGILGVRFYDSRNRKMFEETWQGSNVSSRDLSRMWKSQQLSSKQKVIGYRAVTTGSFITRFGWAVWEP